MLYFTIGTVNRQLSNILIMYFFACAYYELQQQGALFSLQKIRNISTYWWKHYAQVTWEFTVSKAVEHDFRDSLKMAHVMPSFHLFPLFTNKETIQIVQQTNVKNVHPVSCGRIWTHNVFEHESSPVTTRSWLLVSRNH